MVSNPSCDFQVSPSTLSQQKIETVFFHFRSRQFFDGQKNSSSSSSFPPLVVFCVARENEKSFEMLSRNHHNLLVFEVQNWVVISLNTNRWQQENDSLLTSYDTQLLGWVLISSSHCAIRLFVYFYLFFEILEAKAVRQFFTVFYFFVSYHGIDWGFNAGFYVVISYLDNSSKSLKSKTNDWL